MLFSSAAIRGSAAWVLLRGGLVGPIFLAVYFATGQSGLLKRMFWVGLLITAADVLIALALANYGAKSAAKTQLLEQQGVLALAQITGITETGTRINDQPLVKLNLHVSGPGITPFEVQDRVIGSMMRVPKPPASSSCWSIPRHMNTKSIGSEAL